MNTYFRRSSLNKYMYSFGTIVRQEFEPPFFICSLESAMKNTPINFEVRNSYYSVTGVAIRPYDRLKSKGSTDLSILRLIMLNYCEEELVLVTNSSMDL